MVLEQLFSDVCYTSWKVHIGTTLTYKIQIMFKTKWFNNNVNWLW